MRVTNNMMINNTTKNINGNKLNQTNLNNQMTTQKKIQRPSENPVIAIRALRLRSSLSQINQYYEKNIPDVENWFETSETAIKNINEILKDIKTQCNYGNNDNLTQDDRKSILESLTALKEQIYSEGNADNAGRTVFTGYRTNSQLTFMEADAEESYDITQSFTFEDISEYKYYSGDLEVPQTVQEMLDGIANGSDSTKSPYISDADDTTYDRIRLAYDDITELQSISYTSGDATTTFANPTNENVTIDDAGNTITRQTYQGVDKDGNAVAGAKLTVYENEEEWEAAMKGKTVADGEMVFIKNSGDLIMGDNISTDLKNGRADIDVNYEKTGFAKGELRPEYYYNCTCKTDPDHPVEHLKYDAEGNKIYEDINYTIANDQTIKVNMQADELFDMSIYQDVVELTNAVEKAIEAHDKLDKLNEMKESAKYVDYQEEIGKWISAAKKEADYADANMGNLYSAGIGKFDKYMEELNVAYTEIGARGQQLEMTQNRLSNQQLAVEKLKSTNEDRELSDIIIDYTAAYNAYQASLMAASKIEKQTLLNYI